MTDTQPTTGLVASPAGDADDYLSTYACMRCRAAWTSHSEEEDASRRALHDELHKAAELLLGIVPGLAPDEALAAASQLVGSVVNGMANGSDVGALRPAYAFETTRG